MSEIPLIYSELLSNIRQISVIVALDTPSNASTKVELRKGQNFILSHDGTRTSLTLPGKVAPSTQLQSPAIGSRELSWRLPLANQASRVSEDQANEAPWSAASLPKDAGYSCRNCGAIVVRKGAIGRWKDLPSENWAEMMDFWHCHKPNVPHTHESSDQAAVPDKGYGPGSRFVAQEGVGFVDLTTLLLSETDCIGIQTTLAPTQSPQDQQDNLTSKPPYQPLICSKCTSYIGYHDPSSDGSRLYKWRLTLTLSPNSAPSDAGTTPSSQLSPLQTSPPPSRPSLSSILTGQLLSIVHSQCVSRILVLPHPTSTASTSSSSTLPLATNTDTTDKQNGLSLWIFAPSIRFSSSLSSLHQPTSRTSTSTNTNIDTQTIPKTILKPTPAMKIFHQAIPIPLTTTSSAKTTTQPHPQSSSNNAEELYLPHETITELARTLKQSASLLPPSARKFQVWDVGLLERWE